MRGYCGIGVYHPKTEANIGTLWRSAYLYGAQFIFTVGRRYERQSSDTPKTWRNLPLFHFADYADLYAHMPYSCPLICVEMAEGAHDLPTFVHPDRAVYMLGAEDHGIPKDILAGKTVVQIPSLMSQSHNVAVAGSLVLYDRYVKGLPPSILLHNRE